MIVLLNLKIVDEMYPAGCFTILASSLNEFHVVENLQMMCA